jgi:hypothetical protein
MFVEECLGLLYLKLDYGNPLRPAVLLVVNIATKIVL